MKIPETIELYGEEYQIIQLSKHALTCKKCGEECIGTIDWEKKTIFIADDDDNTTPLQILFHELGHYFAYHYDLGKNEIIAEAFAKFVEKIIIKQLKFK